MATERPDRPDTIDTIDAIDAVPAPAAADPSGRPPKRRAHRRLLMTFAIVGLAVIVVGATIAVRRRDDGGPATEASWDPRVEELVHVVEEKRDLTFDHPVPVEFLSEEEFQAEVTSSSADLTDEERSSLQSNEAAFRALGLIGGDVDLLQEMNDLSAGDVAAFYDPERKTVFVREGPMTPLARATLVHELTHALQDQHFDIARLDDQEGSDEASAFRALVEGDAERIENEYVASMSSADAAEYQKELKASQQGAQDAIEGVPTFLVSLFESPYLLGTSLIATLQADGGASRIDEALADPPTTEEHLLDPLTFLAGEPAIDVPTPALGPGETSMDSGDFGAISWYLLLAERLDPRTALAAVDGWGGDSYVVYSTGSQTCIRAAFQGDYLGQSMEMERALDEWMHGSPKDANSVTRAGDIVTLRSCDRGAVGSGVANDLPDQAVLLPFLRASIAAQVLQAGGTEAAAGCSAQQIIDRLPADSVAALTQGRGAKTLRSEIAKLAPSAVQACASLT